MRNNEYIDIHVLETVPPSCVNRDDTGSPKTAIYGGVVRARVSSQCWKRAVREMFHDILPQEEQGLRTKSIHALLAKAISEKNPLLNAEKAAENALKTAGLSLKDENKTGALFFISPSQIDALAELAANSEKLDKKECQAALKATPAVDVALFGRMVADDPSLNFDAAAQVAHAISTEDNAGAGHLGTVEYNSATLYRYATVNVRELQKYLGDRTPEAVRAFVEAFVYSMPTGKINTFANNVPPDAVYVTFRRDRPINLVGAFEKPVQAKDGGYVQPSKEAFAKHTEDIYADYLGEPERALSVSITVGEHCEKMTLSALLDAVEGIVRENGGQA